MIKMSFLMKSVLILKFSEPKTVKKTVTKPKSGTAKTKTTKTVVKKGTKKVVKKKVESSEGEKVAEKKSETEETTDQKEEPPLKKKKTSATTSKATKTVSTPGNCVIPICSLMLVESQLLTGDLFLSVS